MKDLKSRNQLTQLVIFLIVSLNFSEILIAQVNQTGIYIDTRDGKSYKTIKIGDQWILAVNFAYKPSEGNYWAYNNDSSNVAKYGYLYDWETAKSIAPAGWHLPTELDFKKLKRSLGGKREVYKYLGGTMEIVYKQMIAGGNSGFNAILSGIRTNNGKFVLMGERTDYWSSSKSKDGQWFYILDGKRDGKKRSFLDSTDGVASLANQQDNAKGGKSVRLFKD